MRKRIVNETGERRVAHSPLQQKVQQHGKLQLKSSILMQNKAYPNSQQDGLCKSLALIAVDHQECIWYQRKYEKKLLRRRNEEIGHTRIEKSCLVL